MRRFAPLLVSALLVAAVVVPYLALGGGRFEPAPVADPCETRERPDVDGLAETLEAVALAGVDGVACELDVSREELVLALRSEEALDAFARERGLDRDELEQAITRRARAGCRPCRGGRRPSRFRRADRAARGGVGAAVADPRDAREPRRLPAGLAHHDELAWVP